MVSETVAPARPEMATMSPAKPSSMGWRSRPRKARTFEIRPCSTTLPSRDSTLTGWLARMLPARMRPVRTRPR